MAICGLSREIINTVGLILDIFVLALIAVSHASPVYSLGAISGCIDPSGRRLLGRERARFKKFAPFVGRLAEALDRHGRFGDEVRTVGVAITLEGMYELPEREKSRELAKRASGFLAANARERPRLRERLAVLQSAFGNRSWWAAARILG